MVLDSGTWAPIFYKLPWSWCFSHSNWELTKTVGCVCVCVSHVPWLLRLNSGLWKSSVCSLHWASHLSSPFFEKKRKKSNPCMPETEKQKDCWGWGQLMSIWWDPISKNQRKTKVQHSPVLFDCLCKIILILWPWSWGMWPAVFLWRIGFTMCKPDLFWSYTDSSWLPSGLVLPKLYRFFHMPTQRMFLSHSTIPLAPRSPLAFSKNENNTLIRAKC